MRACAYGLRIEQHERTVLANLRLSHCIAVRGVYDGPTGLGTPYGTGGP
jgi:hypothetical protein